MENQEFLRITPPIEIEKIEIFRDGGSIGVDLMDSIDIRYLFCIDGRASSHTLDHVYINAFHPNREDAKLIRQGGKEWERILRC